MSSEELIAFLKTQRSATPENDLSGVGHYSVKVLRNRVLSARNRSIHVGVVRVLRIAPDRSIWETIGVGSMDGNTAENIKPVRWFSVKKIETNT